MHPLITTGISDRDASGFSSCADLYIFAYRNVNTFEEVPVEHEYSYSVVVSSPINLSNLAPRSMESS
jgi:hypothetical protein